MNKGWTIYFSKYKPSPTIFRKIQSIDIFLSVPGLHHTRWVWSKLYPHWKACWYFHHGTPVPTRPQGQKDSLCTISNQFLGLLSTKVWDGGGSNSLNYLRPPISRMPFFGAHPVCGLVYWCQHTQIHVPVPLVSVHLKVFSCEPLRSFILHFFSGESGWLHSTCWGWAALCEQVTQSQRKISFDYLLRERNPIECVHYFPTEEEAAIVGFEAEVDGRLIQSQVDKCREVIMLNSLNNTGCPKKTPIGIQMSSRGLF